MSDDPVVPNENRPARRAPTAAERAYAEQFTPGAIRIHAPLGPNRQLLRWEDGGAPLYPHLSKDKITHIPIPKEALLENQGTSPLDYLDQDEDAAVRVSNAMATGRVPRWSHIPSFRAPERKLTRPLFVPPMVHNKLLDEVKWMPPEVVKPKPMDVSTAEIVEKPLRRTAAKEVLAAERYAREQEPDMVEGRLVEMVKRKRHFIAYDDNDMFAYTTKALSLPPYNPRLPQFFDIVRDGTFLVSRTKLVVIAHDRKAAVHMDLNNEKLTNEGWNLHVLRGSSPPPGTPLVMFSDEWVLGLNVTDGQRDTLTRSFSLTLDGWAWKRSIVPELPSFSPDMADLVDENTCYFRATHSKKHLQVQYGWEDLDEEDKKVLYEGIDMDLRRGRQAFPKAAKIHAMRTQPSEEAIMIIPCAGGVAMSFKRDHTWIFLYDHVAKSYIPHQRIDFVLPKPVVLPSHIYFLAENPEAKGCTSVVARMTRSKEKEFDVISYPKPDDITIGCNPAYVACSGAMPESYSGTGQTAVVVSDDWRSAVVIEFDRRSKLLKLHGGSPGQKKPQVRSTMMTPGT